MKIPHAVEQLVLCATTTEAALQNLRAQLQKRMQVRARPATSETTAVRRLRTATEKGLSSDQDLVRPTNK